MPRLVWDEPGTRIYESGVDRGVLYVSGVGVPWNGIAALTESSDGGEAQPLYFDGYKYSNLSSSEEFEASLETFGAPIEFAQCDGLGLVQSGLYAAQQPRKKFGLSYRTNIGSDTDPELAYKIHLVYGCLADPSDVNHTTISSDSTPVKYNWRITSMPQRIAGKKPTAHFVVDTRTANPVKVASLEDIIYGSDTNTAHMPTAVELVTLFST